MLVKQLMRIPEFVNVPCGELRALAARTHVLWVPGNRWLVQPGRDIDAYFYLLRGSVETQSPRQRQRAKVAGKLEHFYPGGGGVRTLKSAQILRIERSHHDFVTQSQCGHVDLAGLNSEKWLERFLSSHMMRELPGGEWQRLLQAFRPQEFSSGRKILRRGSYGNDCYVIEAGHAVVHQGSNTLCHLNPGDFFGEDALVLGHRRNADVSALEPVRVQAIDKLVFTSVLLENLVQFVSHCTKGVRLQLVGNDQSAGGGLELSLVQVRETAAKLDPRMIYYIVGSSRQERALCALLLVQRGLRAFPLDERAS